MIKIEATSSIYAVSETVTEAKAEKRLEAIRESFIVALRRWRRKATKKQLRDSPILIVKTKII